MCIKDEQILVFSFIFDLIVDRKGFFRKFFSMFRVSCVTIDWEASV
jgi:hypothetical protein